MFVALFVHHYKLDGNCHGLRMHLSKFVCGNMPGLLVTFRSRNLLFCLEFSFSPPKARHMRAVFPCIDAALNSVAYNDVNLSVFSIQL